MVGPLEAVPAPRHPLTPRPVPSAPLSERAAPVAGAGSALSPDAPAEGGVTDEDRNRYGALLDRAADRGLLSLADYQVRLGELAEATTMEQMHRIVTELPVFSAPPAKTNAASRRRPRASAPPGSALPRATPDAPWAGAPGNRTLEGRGRWLVLAAMVAVLVVSIIVLALFAAHLTHVRSVGLPVWRPRSGAALLSALRL